MSFFLKMKVLKNNDNELHDEQIWSNSIPTVFYCQTDMDFELFLSM